MTSSPQRWPWTQAVSPDVYKHRNDWPKISIVTPSFNQGHYIEETILSVLNQNYPNLEFIIMDGGSTDNTVEIIKKYQSKITYWVSEPDKGQSDAINKGIAKSTGYIFNWLNSDDYYEPNTFLQLAEAYFARPDTTCWAGGIRQFTDGQPDIINDVPAMRIESVPLTMATFVMLQPATFFTLDTFHKLKGVNTHLRYIMDLDFWVRYLLMENGQHVVSLSHQFTWFRMHEASKSVFEGDKFVLEIDNLFASLAQKYNYTKVFQVIRSLPESANKQPYELFIPNANTVSREVVQKALNFYLLERGHILYAKRRWAQARIFFDAIDSSLLTPPLKAVYERIYFRLKYVPAWVGALLSKK